MTSNRQTVPLFIKLIIIVYEKSFLFGLLYSAPILMIVSNSELHDTQSFIDIRYLIVPMIVFLGFGLYYALKKIKLIENYNLIKKGIYVGEIGTSELVRNNRPSFIFRLTLEIPIQSEKKSIFKHFYLINKPIGRSNYDYKVILRHENPHNMILLNSLPSNVRAYIEE